VITVRELIVALGGMPQDLPVAMEGCDCADWCRYVRVLDLADGRQIVALLRGSDGREMRDYARYLP